MQMFFYIIHLQAVLQDVEKVVFYNKGETGDRKCRAAFPVSRRAFRGYGFHLRPGFACFRKTVSSFAHPYNPSRAYHHFCTVEFYMQGKRVHVL